MKKSIEFINISMSSVNFLIEKLINSSESIENLDIFLESLKGLQENKIDSIMLQLDDNDIAQTFSTDVIEYNDLCIYPKSRRVTVDKEDISLTPKEFDILYFLAKNKGEVFTKEQIYQAVWQDEYMLDDSNIMAFIRKLRKKIELNPDSPQYIHTVWGIGYKFDC